MKTCELCGLENPDEARFCMKCGRDLDAVKSSESPEDALDTEAFTPAAAGEDARLAPTASSQPKPSKPHADIESYEREAAASIKSYESQAAGGADEPPEIQLTGVTSDFTEKKYCERCGIANPREQRYCKQCGSALLQEAPGHSDLAYEAPSMIPLAPEPIQTTLLTDISPSAPASDCYTDSAPGDRASRRPGTNRGRARGLGTRELGMALAVMLVLALLLFLFALGGYSTLFSGKARKVRGAGGVMERLASFQYGITAAVETSDGVQYAGSGKVIREAPDRSYWEIRLDVPGSPRTVSSMQVGGNVYVNGPTWQAGDPARAAADVRGLWGNFSRIEDLGAQVIGSSDCYHYKYRTQPSVLTTALGAGDQTGVSDAVIEIWVDKASSRVVKLNATLYNVVIEGARATVNLTMDLAATGQAYGIKAPL